MTAHSTTFPGLPDLLWRHGHVLCAQFCDWDQPSQGEAWVELDEEIFGALGAKPARGYVSVGRREQTTYKVGPEARGVWKRVRKRATELLTIPSAMRLLSIATQYKYNVGESPGDACAIIKSGQYFPLTKSQVLIAVSSGIAASPALLLEKIGPLLGRRTCPKWGAVFKFPLAAGAQFYLNGTTYSGTEVRELGPPGAVLADHEQRVHRANYRTSTEFSYRSGYVREVYEINLLSTEHLRAPLLGSTVSAYVESIGIVRKSPFISDLYEWQLSSKELAKARTDWEESGLVLSAEREPFRWQ